MELLLLIFCFCPWNYFCFCPWNYFNIPIIWLQKNIHVNLRETFDRQGLIYPEGGVKGIHLNLRERFDRQGLTYPEEESKEEQLAPEQCKVIYIELYTYIHYILTLYEHQARAVLKAVNAIKAAGPDVVLGIVVKNCADQLARVLTRIFNISLQMTCDLSCLKAATIVPVPKKTAINCLNDYRPSH